MYEEEDDDLPLQYRRLTAHLQTGSADFNRRLSAYLTNHVAMRSALEQSIHNSYAQQFPNAPQYQQQNMFPSPMLAHQQQQQMPGQQGMMQPPTQGYRQHPYQSPQQQQQQGFTLPHQRANSIAVPQSSTPSSPAIPPNHKRSASMSASDSQTPTIDPRSPQTPGSQHQKPSFAPGSFQQHQQPQQPFALPSYDMGAFGQAVFPFSAQLPAETQGLLGNPLSQGDPLTTMMMAGSDPNMFWNFNQNPVNTMGVQSNNSPMGSNKLQEQVGGPQNAPSFAGLNTTLAPASTMVPKAAPITKPNKIDLDAEVSPTSDGTGEEEIDFGNGGENSLSSDLFFENAMIGKDGTTPGLNGDSWDSWIHDGSWGDIPTASQ